MTKTKKSAKPPVLRMRENAALTGLHLLLGFTGANFYTLTAFSKLMIPIGIIAFLLANCTASMPVRKFPSKKLKNSYHGIRMLKMFLVTTILSILFLAVMLWTGKIDGRFPGAIPYFLIPFFAELVYFWNGILFVYIHSKQLGIKYRVIGILAGWIPLVHLAVLSKILSISSREVKEEYEKAALNDSRADEQICATKYPILMVHGVFFRDFEHFNYWGRIPAELEKNGAMIHYGNHQSALSVPESAAELAERIEEIVETTGCEKVNVIAHSKGGLDTRYAISMLGSAPYVASLTTINTPHRGCEFADFLLSKAGDGLKDKVASAYNAGARKLGDASPDFISAVTDLTASKCSELNVEMSGFDFKAAGIYTQSVGSSMVKATSGHFPLNMSYLFVKNFDGKNDGLVGEDSFQWGEDYTFVEPEKQQGISHGDMIDLNRENIDGFDAREFYVQLVAALKKRGL